MGPNFGPAEQAENALEWLKVQDHISSLQAKDMGQYL